MTYLTATPNAYGCHDPQCGDSTWDHDCPTIPPDDTPIRYRAYPPATTPDPPRPMTNPT